MNGPLLRAAAYAAASILAGALLIAAGHRIDHPKGEK